MSKKFISASEWCQKTHEQNCHACDNADCGDNVTPSIVKMRQVEVDLRADLVSRGIDPDLLKEVNRLESKVRSLETRNGVMAGELKKAEILSRDLLRKNDELAADLSDRANELADLREAVADAVILFGRGAKEHKLSDMVDAVKTAETMREGGKG